MKYGLYVAPIESNRPITAIAQEAEDRGFDSIWIPEHVHIPVDRKTPYPFSPDGSLPETHYRLPDPFVALMAAATATTELKVATGICLVTEHEPIATAKAIASLDSISGGRFLFGIGAGWLPEEMEPLGVKFADRWRVTEHRVRAMKALWTEETAEYHSEFVDFPATYLYPKPAQKPHPPIYIGTSVKYVYQRIVDWADGWLPNVNDPVKLAEGMAALRQTAEASGRDPDSIPVTMFNARRDALAEYERLGVERVVLMPRDPSDMQTADIDEVTRVFKGG
jgi:probable F420-dependent oxidoreductase